MLDELQVENLIFDILTSFDLAMASEGIDTRTRGRVMLTVEDAIDNNAGRE